MYKYIGDESSSGALNLNPQQAEVEALKAENAKLRKELAAPPAKTAVS